MALNLSIRGFSPQIFDTHSPPAKDGGLSVQMGSSNKGEARDARAFERE